jgi:hypothetical protein
MSVELLVVLTVVEIVLLVAVLAVFVLLLTRRLQATADTLGQVAGGLGAVQEDVALVGPGAALLESKLRVIVGALPAIAAKAESVAAGR